ncbi:hypothetical protein QWY84_13530 [Aquisalimonas lutea]|uniref:hypothetical protein n=1 Tax=Aquisalimonas lutea TaxID=1327750 RepID=UPI0025B356A5|nr:hypothetical protein [Aquisalimonas lutea]MDN3518636.1 hypothetical protein [Aquisalimonas lutea]
MKGFLRYCVLLLILAPLAAPLAQAPEPDSILEQARELRNNHQLDRATELLDEALQRVDPTHPRHQALRLERYYHLRMARIREHLSNDNVEAARAVHDEVEQFLRGHPQRSRFMSNIDRYDLVIRGRE